MVLALIMVKRSITCACGLIGMVFHAGVGPPIEAALSGAAPGLMLLVSTTRVLPSQWPRLSPIQLVTFAGGIGPPSSGMMRASWIISRLITT